MKMELDAGDDIEKSSNQQEQGRKRTLNDDGNNISRKRKKKEPHYQQPKNALMQLNELKPGLKYVIECEKQSPLDLFTASVIVNNEKYEGKGRSKQLAKHAAAEAALKSFIQFRNTSDAVKSISRDTAPIDFTDDSLNIEGTMFDDYQESRISSVPSATNSCVILQSKINDKLRKTITETDKKNPVMLLNELCPGLTYELSSEDHSSQKHWFSMNVVVDGMLFNGSGQSKKVAKAAAARAVLAQKFGINFSTSQCLDEVDKVMFDVPQILADNIGKCVHDVVDKIMKANPRFPKWRVLAGVVMTNGQGAENMQTVCLGTGSKILKPDYLNFKGAALNDCHAEVIARRCFKDFLFSQLEFHVNGNSNKSIFQRFGDKFKLKPNIKFHFYVTSIPCGDASMFSLHEETITGLKLDSIEHGSGMLRSKLEFGTIPVGSVSGEQKFEDIRRKVVKYMIMSCSDKITLWNVLGVQGSLLNYFIDPIYFDTIIFGQPFHGYHMLNCMFKRIENSLEGLPLPFSLHKPKLACTSTWFARSLDAAPKLSMNWTCGTDKPEMVISNNGKPREKPMSRLSKLSFLQRFYNLSCLLPKGKSVEQQSYYGKLKRDSPNYFQAKEVVVKAFLDNGLGYWKKKPNEQDMFDLSTHTTLMMYNE